MAGPQFEIRLAKSIEDVYYKVEYVAYYIREAQKLYDAGEYDKSQATLAKAAERLREAGENEAAEKVEYFLPFIYVR